MAKNLTQNKDFEFWDKIQYLFSDSNLFFENLRYENGIKNAVIMYCIVGLFVSAASFLFSFTLGRMAGGMSGIFKLSYGFMFFPIFGFVFGLIMTFVYSGLVHMLVIAFKGQGTFADTYKAYAYSMIPSSILSIIPFIGFFSIIYSYFLMIIGVSKLHNISKGYSALACLLPVILVFGLLIYLVIVIIFRFSHYF
jgi:hypothetical protein